jgi:hypothetical protein
MPLVVDVPAGVARLGPVCAVTSAEKDREAEVAYLQRTVGLVTGPDSPAAEAVVAKALASLDVTAARVMGLSFILGNVPSDSQGVALLPDVGLDGRRGNEKQREGDEQGESDRFHAGKCIPALIGRFSCQPQRTGRARAAQKWRDARYSSMYLAVIFGTKVSPPICVS